MRSTHFRSGILALAWVVLWAGAAAAQPAASGPGDQKVADTAPASGARGTVELFGNFEFSPASWSEGTFVGNQWGGNGGVRIYPSPNSRRGFGFRVSGLTDRVELGSGSSFQDRALVTAFGGLYVHWGATRAQVYFFTGGGLVYEDIGHHYEWGGTTQHSHGSSTSFGFDVGVGLKVALTKRLAIAPEVRAVTVGGLFAPPSIAVGITYTFPLR